MMILINYDDIDYDYDCNWSVGQGQKFFSGWIRLKILGNVP